MIHAFMAMAAQAQNPLSLHSIITGIPHDGPAIVIYVLTAASLYWVFTAGRKQPPKDERKS